MQRSSISSLGRASRSRSTATRSSCDREVSSTGLRSTRSASTSLRSCASCSVAKNARSGSSRRRRMLSPPQRASCAKADGPPSYRSAPSSSVRPGSGASTAEHRGWSISRPLRWTSSSKFMRRPKRAHAREVFGIAIHVCTGLNGTGYAADLHSRCGRQRERGDGRARRFVSSRCATES